MSGAICAILMGTPRRYDKPFRRRHGAFLSRYALATTLTQVNVRARTFGSNARLGATVRMPATCCRCRAALKQGCSYVRRPYGVNDQLNDLRCNSPGLRQGIGPYRCAVVATAPMPSSFLDSLSQLSGVNAISLEPSAGGTSMPSALGGLQVMAISKLVSVCTGGSAGVAPLRIPRRERWALQGWSRRA